MQRADLLDGSLALRTILRKDTYTARVPRHRKVFHRKFFIWQVIELHIEPQDQGCSGPLGLSPGRSTIELDFEPNDVVLNGHCYRIALFAKIRADHFLAIAVEPIKTIRRVVTI